MRWFKKTIQLGPREAVWVALGAFLTSAVSAAIGYLQSMPNYLYLPLVAVTFASVLMIVNIFVQLKGRFIRHSDFDIPEDQLADRITQWLVRAGYEVSLKETTQSPLFNLTATVRDTRLNIARIRELPDQIQVCEGYTLTSDQIDAINILPSKEWAEITEDISIDIASFDIELGTIALPVKQGESYYLRDQIPIGSLLDKETLFERMSYVSRATTVVSAYIQRALRLAREKTP